jgi:hypothetical protein
MALQVYTSRPAHLKLFAVPEIKDQSSDGLSLTF